MLSINSYKPDNTYFHKCHPLIKFLGFLCIFFILFINNSVFVQICLILIIFSIAYVSNIFQHIGKRTLKLYIWLLLFLLFINWLFNKNPGFWSYNRLASYKEIFGNPFSLSSFTPYAPGSTATTSSTVASAAAAAPSSAGSSSADYIFNGWFWGGDLVTVSSSDSKIVYSTDPDCIKAATGIATSGGGCSSVVSSRWQEYSPKNLKIFSTYNANGQSLFVGFYSKWYTITALQFVHALNMTNKLVLVIILTSSLSLTTSMSNLAYAFEDLFKPLKLFKIQAEELALIVSIVVRFAPSLLDESFRIIRAQASRGIDFKNGKMKDKLTSVLSLFVPLFVIAFIKSEELASAITVRGYQPRKIRSSAKRHMLSSNDYIPFSLLIIVLTILHTITFSNGYCSIFGNIEYLLLFAK